MKTLIQKTKAPLPLLKANDSGIKHMVLILWDSPDWHVLLCINPGTNVLQTHITAMRAFRQPCHMLIVSSHRHQCRFLEKHVDCGITVHKAHGQKAKYFPVVSMARVTSRSQKQWTEHFLYQVCQLDGCAYRLFSNWNYYWYKLENALPGTLHTLCLLLAVAVIL